ncbi:MAG: OmpA family protein [Duncaniella sp.]|nr:OmpA family protein [Duncaniella sp.]
MCIRHSWNINQNWKLGIELQANVLPDGYNSKKAGNADWYFNGLVGVKYTFGSSFTKSKKALPVATVTEYVEKVVEVPVEKVVVKEVIKEIPAALTRDVFFKISTTKVTKDEMYKVAEVARYLKENPSAKVTVTGYADKGTGSLAINLRLAAQRAQAVVDALTREFGVDASRITSASMGEEENQPYDTPELNRVAICVAK